jgi:hypothetical protein
MNPSVRSSAVSFSIAGLLDVVLVGIGVISMAATTSAFAQSRPIIPDAQIMRESKLVASGPRVDLYQHGVGVDTALLDASERALTRMEEILGRGLDVATLGPRIQIYVSSAITVSHVWRGYDHPSDPRPALFLNATVARLALRGTNATYAHEMAHLLTWRYASHTLREGLADYLALQVHPGAGIGPNAGNSPPEVLTEMEDYLGTTRAPPAAVTANLRFRQSYYFASYRFVRFLIERAGMATFLKLYDAKDPENEFMPLYGAGRRELAAASMK